MKSLKKDMILRKNQAEHTKGKHIIFLIRISRTINSGAHRVSIYRQVAFRILDPRKTLLRYGLSQRW
jgi:hypothetical protein